VRLLVAEHHGEMLEADFAADVTVTARLAVEQTPGFQAALRELSNGALTAEIVETNPATILPLPPGTQRER